MKSVSPQSLLFKRVVDFEAAEPASGEPSTCTSRAEHALSVCVTHCITCTSPVWTVKNFLLRSQINFHFRSFGTRSAFSVEKGRLLPVAIPSGRFPSVCAPTWRPSMAANFQVRTSKVRAKRPRHRACHSDRTAKIRTWTRIARVVLNLFCCIT